MPITLPVEARADERSFKQVGQQAESYFSRAGKEASGSFTKAFGAGAKDARKAADGYAKAMDAVADATGKSTLAEKSRQDALDRSAAAAKKAEAAEDQLKAARKSGDAKAVAAAEVQLTRAREAQTRATTAVVKSAEAAGAAKRRELRAVREATTAYRNLEQAQASKGPGFLSGITSQSSGIVGQFQMLGGMGGKAFIGGAVAAMAAVGLIEAGKKAAGLVLDGFKATMETGIDFSKSVNSFQGVTGASAADARRAAAAARQLGADPTMAGVNASGSMQALTELARSGMSVDESMANLRSTMELATAGQIDAAQAAEIQAASMNAFNLTAVEGARVADIFAGAANSSPAGIADLGQALSQVGGVAAGFGWEMNETISMLAMFAKAGIKGSDAGTLLKTTLQSLTKQGEPAQRALQALGMDVFDDAGNMVGADEFIRQLEEAKKRLRPEDFLAATNQLFGTDAMRTPMVANLGLFNEILGKTNEIGNAAQTAKAQMQGWPGVVEGIDNSVEALKLSFYDLFNTPAGQDLGNKLVAGLGGAVDWVNQHKPELLAFVAQVGDTAMAVGDSMMGMAQVWLQTAAMLSDGLAYTIGTALEGLMKVGNFTGRVLSKVPGMWGDVGRSLMDVTQDVDDFVDGWQSAGGTMRATAAMITPMRDGLKDMRTGFKDAMADAVASEEANRSWGSSFDDVKSSLEEIPNSKEMLIKENTDEVRSKLEQLGFEIQSLPDGRQVIRVEYRDAAGNPVAPKMIGGAASIPVTVPPPSGGLFGSGGAAIATTPSTSPGGLFGSAGAATPRPAPQVLTPPPAPAEPTSGPGVGGILGPGGILEGSKSGAGGSGPDIAVPYADIPALMPGVAMDAGLFSQQTAVADARTKVAQKEAELNALRADNNASATDILNAQNELEKARRDQTEAEMRFTEAQLKAGQQTTKQLGQLTSELGDIGASIDQDFGISKGLAGIAENVTKFIANLAMAPLMGQLSAVAKANPTQGGHGLMGILGASGVFGSQYQNDQYAGQGGYASVAGSTGVQMYGGGRLGQMMTLAQQASGRTTYAPASDLVNGLADCSGSISDLYEVLKYGQTTSGREFTTTNFATDAEAAKLGFLPGYMPGALNVGVNPYPGMSGHMAATLPNGVNFEGGGNTGGGAQYGGNAAGALSSQFEKQYYLPVGGGGGQSYGPLTGSALTNPALTSPATGGGGGGMGVGPGFAPAPSAAPTRIGGLAPVGGSGGGGIGIQSGGLVDMAIQAGGMGLDMMAPGAGQAAQLGIKLGARAAEYAGQAAGIGVQGLMETFLPTGGSELANSNWLTRIAGGLAGAAPALPNMAGKGQGGQLENPNGEQGQGQGGQQQPGMNIEKLEYNNQNATEDRAGKDLTYHLGSMYAAPGM